MDVRRVSQQTYRDEIKRLRGKTARRRDRAISNKLHEVHRSYLERENGQTGQDNGTILFDLT